MGSMRIETADSRKTFEPGDTIAGTASWSVPGVPRTAELRLLWYTRGKGTPDASVVEVAHFAAPRTSDSRDFSFTLPRGPYSFSGALVSVVWALELVVEPISDVVRFDFVMGPSGSEVLAGNVTPYASP
jgi:hypothetical protein